MRTLSHLRLSLLPVEDPGVVSNGGRERERETERGEIWWVSSKVGFPIGAFGDKFGREQKPDDRVETIFFVLFNKETTLLINTGLMPQSVPRCQNATLWMR